MLKVFFEGEVRRFRIASPSTEDAREWLESVRMAVHEGLGLSPSLLQPCALTLKYKDEEGDLCTLADATAEDFATISGSGPLRLYAFPAVAYNDTINTTNLLEDDTVLEAAACSEPAPSPSHANDVLWASSDGKLRIILAEVPRCGLQPRLHIRSDVFDIKICLAREDETFSGSAAHTAVLERCLDALCRVAPAIARTPCWHRVSTTDGCSVLLRPCLEHQLHLCLKHRRV